MIIPLGTDWKTGRRPWATITLIGLNVLAFAIAWGPERTAGELETQQLGRLLAVESDIESRYLPRTGPRAEPGPFGVLPSRLRGRSNLEARFWEEFAGGLVVDDDHPDFVSWEDEHDAWDAAHRARPYYRWGVHGDSRNPLAPFTAMFLHFGFWHLFFNMVFLWAVGVNLEDVWGRGYFVLVYLLSGLVAEMAFWLFTPGADEAIGVGASGAVAGMMGAFLVRHWKRKIRFFLLFTFSIWSAPAWVLLPFWFVTELYAATSGPLSGVAHWAHVGGFVGGGVLGLALAHSRVEDALVPQLEAAHADQQLARHLELSDRLAAIGDTRMLVRELEAARAAAPRSPEPLLRLAALRLDGGSSGDGIELGKQALRLQWQAGQRAAFLETFRWLDAMPAAELDGTTVLRAATSLTDRDAREAANLAWRVVQSEPAEPLRTKAYRAYADILDRLGATDQATQVRRLIEAG